MHTAAVVLPALSALALALVAGVHLAGSGALNRALRSLDDATYLRVKQALDAAFGPLMKPLLLGALALAAAAVVAVVVDGGAGAGGAGAGGAGAGGAGAGAAGATGGLALAAGVVVLVAVLQGDVPINQRMATWDPATPPEDLAVHRAAWERWFAVRSAASGVAAGAALVTALLAVA